MGPRVVWSGEDGFGDPVYVVTCWGKVFGEGNAFGLVLCGGIGHVLYAVGQNVSVLLRTVVYSVGPLSVVAVDR